MATEVKYSHSINGNDKHPNKPIEFDEKSLATAKHDAIKQAMGTLVLPYIDFSRPGLRILDSGTADGYFLCDLRNSETFHSSSVFIGTDIYATTATTPTPDITLMTQSVKEPWPVAWHNSFDLVHQRLVLGAVGSFSHRTALHNLCQLVKPGGWIQLVEPEQVIGAHDGPAMNEFMMLIRDVFFRMGGHSRYTASIAGWLEEAGMQDVQERGVALTYGALNPDPELAARTAASTAIDMGPLISYAKDLPQSTSLSNESLDSLISRLKEELHRQGAYYPLRVIWARKPMTSS